MNFLKRTVTAVVFAAVMLFCIIKGGIWFIGLGALITLLTTVEFTGLVNRYKGAHVCRLWSAVSALLLYAAISFTAQGSGTILHFLPFILSLIVITVRQLYIKQPNPSTDIALTLMPLMYIALPFSLLPVLGYCFSAEPGQYSFVIPLSLFIFLWSNDVGAYCTGCTIGRHKLFERISPKKTWEGSAGGAVLTVLAAWLLHRFLPDMYSFMPVWVWIGMAAVTVLFGTWGDLFESLLKREMGIKDSGRILPGHGGMLDRFDSALLAIPATTIWLSIAMTVL